MARIKLDIDTQIKITKYLQSNPNAAREHFERHLAAAGTPAAPSSIRTQLSNAILGLPLNEQWYQALVEWAQDLPTPKALSTIPPPPLDTPAVQHIVYWLPGQVERRLAPSGTGRVLWRAADVCERFGLRRTHAQTHRGTLVEGDDFELDQRRGMWLTKRGALKLLMRSREAGVPGSPLNKLFNEVINVYVEFSDTGLVVHRARAEALAEVERQRALDAAREQAAGELPPAVGGDAAALRAELERLRSELARLTDGAREGP